MMNEYISCLDGKFLIANDVDAVSVRNDDDHREVVDVWRIVRVILENEHVEREVLLKKDQLPLKLDSLCHRGGGL
jgi:hypothetical protein